jgi:hypothetical protein
MRAFAPGLVGLNVEIAAETSPKDISAPRANQRKKAKYIGLRFHDLCRTGIRNISKKGIPEKVGVLIRGHRSDSVYRRDNIVDVEVLKTATAKIEELQTRHCPSREQP